MHMRKGKALTKFSNGKVYILHGEQAKLGQIGKYE